MNILKTTAIIIGITLMTICSSCDNSNQAPAYRPSNIENVTIGSKDQKIFHHGDHILIEADITSTKIKEVNIQVTPLSSSRGWIVSKTFTEKYQGKVKAHLHEELIVPEKVRVGTHELLITVTDLKGNKVNYKQIIEIEKSKLLPTIAKPMYQINAGVMTITTKITAPEKIKAIILEIQSSAWTEEFKYDGDDVTGQKEIDFNRSIDFSTAPNGHYHINMTVIDQKGNKSFNWSHFDK